MGRGEALHTHMMLLPVLFGCKGVKKKKKANKQMALAKLKEKIIARKLDSLKNRWKR